MINFRKILSSTLLIASILLGNFSTVFAESGGINVNMEVGGCNYNNVCEEGEEDMFSCPSDCTSGTTYGSIPTASMLFYDLTIEVSYNSAIIRWKSRVPTITSLKWGTSADYKDGVLKNVNYLLEHRVELNNLKDGTLYYFSIEAVTQLKQSGTLENQVFKTLTLPDTTPPGNPTNVKAVSNVAGITITWTNPTDLDFDYVRVMRNDNRFYGSPFTGRLVYEGKGTYLNDVNVKKGHKYYYSLFARDTSGNYSSGALISIIYNPDGTITEEVVKDVPVVPVVPVGLVQEIYFVSQFSSIYDFKFGNQFYLSGDDPIEIKTDYTHTVKNEDMWVEARNFNNEIVARYFFTRVKDKDGFLTTTIPSFVRGGEYKINIYRYRLGELSIVNQGTFHISKVSTGEGVTYCWWCLIWVIMALITLTCIIIRIAIIEVPKLRKYKSSK